MLSSERICICLCWEPPGLLIGNYFSSLQESWFHKRILKFSVPVLQQECSRVSHLILGYYWQRHQGHLFPIAVQAFSSVYLLSSCGRGIGTIRRLSLFPCKPRNAFQNLFAMVYPGAGCIVVRGPKSLVEMKIPGFLWLAYMTATAMWVSQNQLVSMRT